MTKKAPQTMKKGPHIIKHRKSIKDAWLGYEYNKPSTEYTCTSSKKHQKEQKYVSSYKSALIYGVAIPADKCSRQTCWTDRITADYHYRCTRETNIRLIEYPSSRALTADLILLSSAILPQ